MTDHPPTRGDEIVFQTMLSDVDETAINNHLRAPYIGRLYRLKLVAVYVVVVGLGMVLLDRFAGLSMFTIPVMATIYLTLFASICVIVVGSRTAHAVQARILASPIRQLPVRYVISARGVERNGALTPWDMIVDIRTLNNVTLLMISDLEAFPIAHKRLPQGIDPAAFHARIDAWRAAA